MLGDAICSETALEAEVREAMMRTKVIDCHTHLFPASHGDLMLWGIDALLTYHYLVSEFFMVAPMTLSHADFFACSRRQQADLVWEYLFVRRLPLSEAAIGVVTTLSALGLQEQARSRDLTAIRAWFSKQDRAKHVQNVLNIAGVERVVMTNIPYEEREACVWRRGGNLPQEFASALRVDSILLGDWRGLCDAVQREEDAQYGLASDRHLGVATLGGLRAYLEVWAKRMRPEYLMASTPATFVYEDMLWRAGTDVIESPREVPTASELIDKVLIPVARKLELPLAIKIGAYRGMEPGLDPCGGGDGVLVADMAPLRLLCSKNPHLRVLATVLSIENQQELAVLAQKFRNLHIYGCWWYCNAPSMINTITRMRLELLGTAFTAQHSDARVLEQLIYKWKHSREAIIPAVVDQLVKLFRAGWKITKEDVWKQSRMILGGAYKDFIEDIPTRDMSGGMENMTLASALGSVTPSRQIAVTATLTTSSSPASLVPSRKMPGLASQARRSSSQMSPPLRAGSIESPRRHSTDNTSPRSTMVPLQSNKYSQSMQGLDAMC